VIRRLALSLALLTAGAALLVAAALAAAPGQAAKGGILRIASPVEPDYLDPALAYTSRAWTLEYATCAKLFNFPDAAGAAGARVVPEVVNRYSISHDGKTYTFDLSRTFRFHTGAPVTANSFAEAFNRDANPRMQSPATAYMHEIVGADAVVAGKSATISGVRVLAPYRLQIRLTKPLGDFTARLTAPFFCPLLPNTPVDPAGIENPPGSGPYYIAERVLNRQTVLRRNPFYRGQRPANVDEIVHSVGMTPDACAAAVEQDRVDYCLFAPFPDATVRRLVQQYGINQKGGRFFVAPGLATWYLAFNHDRPAFKGARQIPLAKAINFAIDRPALSRAFGYLFGRRTDQMLPPALGRDASIYPLTGADPATALKWLKKARYRPAKLVFYTWTTPFGVAVAQNVAFELKQIGIDVEVKNYEQLTLADRVGTRGEPFDVALLPWAPDYADGASYFVPLLDGRNLRPTGNGNTTYFDDPQTNASIDKANALTGETRRGAWAEVDVELMRTNPPWAPIIHSLRRDFISKSYGCYVSNPESGIDLAAACKKSGR
jgi:ABC-type transport system substrate-binding protein